MDEDPDSRIQAPDHSGASHSLPASVLGNGESHASGGSTLGRIRDRLIGALGFQSGSSIREELEATLKRPDAVDEFSPSERFMLLNILRFSEARVDDAMVPRADIVAIEEEASLAEALHTFQKAGHSRLPVYRDSLDEPLGFVHIKDLVAWVTDRAVRPEANGNAEGPADRLDLSSVDLSTSVGAAGLVRELLYVPTSMRAVDLLVKMQTTHVHMAIVIDEYGGTDGLLTIEDLVEEIVGDIEDEHDTHEGPLIRRESETSFVADARAPIEDLEELLGFPLLPGEREEYVDTLGGLVFTRVGRIPVRGEILHHAGGVEFEVLESDLRRIKRLRIRLSPPSGEADAALDTVGSEGAPRA